MNIVCHVADPWTFWDKEKCPPSAYTAGWAYVDGTFVDKETLHSEVDRMLKKHPKLNITFAHFYYLPHELERLADFLDRNPSVSIDICPGTPNFYDFQADINKTRDFFIKYQDRIIFGTDNGVNEHAAGDEVAIRANKQYVDLFRFLELSEVYTPARWSEPLCGIGLDGDALKKIYLFNYKRLQGGERKINIGKAVEFCEKRLSIIKNNTPDNIYINQINEVIAFLKAL